MQRQVIHTVDLHTHILPGVDDGAENINEALEMLDIAVSNGTTHLVLTPHYLTNDTRSQGVKKEELCSRFELFRDAIAVRYPKLSLCFGAEMFAVSNIENVIADGGIIPINGTKYVLTEFKFNDHTARVLEITDALLGNGYIPVIAHPERYLFLQSDPSCAVKFIERGAVFQINSTSMANYSSSHTRELAFYLLANEFATVIASDCHSTYQRKPDLSEAYAFVSSSFSSAYAEDLFFNNPLSIINGKRI